MHISRSGRLPRSCGRLGAVQNTENIVFHLQIFSYSFYYATYGAPWNKLILASNYVWLMDLKEKANKLNFRPDWNKFGLYLGFKRGQIRGCSWPSHAIRNLPRSQTWAHSPPWPNHDNSGFYRRYVFQNKFKIMLRWILLPLATVQPGRDKIGRQMDGQTNRPRQEWIK